MKRLNASTTDVGRCDNFVAKSSIFAMGTLKCERATSLVIDKNLEILRLKAVCLFARMARSSHALTHQEYARSREKGLCGLRTEYKTPHLQFRCPIYLDWCAFYYVSTEIKIMHSIQTFAKPSLCLSNTYMRYIFTILRESFFDLLLWFESTVCMYIQVDFNEVRVIKFFCLVRAHRSHR